MLDFYIDRINKKLKEMHEHYSYDEMGKMLGISTSNVAALINGTRPIKSPSLDLLLKVFPDCKIFLEDNPAGIPSATLAKEKAKAVEDFRQKAIMAVLTLDNIPSDAVVEVAKAIKDL
jgi:transcriptional regulator with XRE-family HTH domain